MLSSRSVLNTVKRLIGSAILFSVCVPAVVLAQSTAAEQNDPQQSQRLTTQPPPESPPDVNRPPRTIHRIGTAIGAPRNSVSIKSTDAGTIPRQPAASGCINCGVINFVNRIGQGPGLNAIAGGVVAGTVAREIIRQNPYPHDTSYPGTVDGAHARSTAQPHDQYQVGITMNDGQQAIIALPNAANFHQGDRIRLVDGVLVPDRP
ncbi:hypothetical protein R2103_09295 [Nitrosomonas sp. Is24]|uniref:hypothetical protein n=1 Tax=Nitrosomonas sp. Is24 TaxID=3080533 RepID=UPI00294B277D|nr:hypothetical protein [Nitrosomonas sp. Is24]MDV6341955.1 hypothetical protein [Nitrosomonas sp. Is24]